MYANQQKDEVVISAADILCQDLTRKITGEQPSDQYFKRTSKLADMIIEGKYKVLQDIGREAIIFPYDKK